MSSGTAFLISHPGELLKTWSFNRPDPAHQCSMDASDFPVLVLEYHSSACQFMMIKKKSLRQSRTKAGNHYSTKLQEKTFLSIKEESSWMYQAFSLNVIDKVFK